MALRKLSEWFDKMKEQFTFLNPGKLTDGDLELVLTKKVPADLVKGYVPEFSYYVKLIILKVHLF
jgi:hypothetical protein